MKKTDKTALEVLCFLTLGLVSIFAVNDLDSIILDTFYSITAVFSFFHAGYIFRIHKEEFKQITEER